MAIPTEYSKKIVTLLQRRSYCLEGLANLLDLPLSQCQTYIEALKAQGFGIISDEYQGYHLSSGFELLDINHITHCARAVFNHCDVSIFDCVDSTNAFLKNQPSNPPFQLCLAEQQTAGKGRFDRTWASPFAQNIYFSLKFQYRNDINQIGGLSVVVAVALVDTLNALGVDQGVLIKWPNDVLHNGNKLSGILIETVKSGPQALSVIIGIGLNVNMIQQDLAIDWTSIRKITDRPYNRNFIVEKMLSYISASLAQFENNGIEPFIAQYNRLNFLLDKRVELAVGKQRYKGLVNSVDRFGNLQVLLDSGQKKSFSSGEVVLKK